MESGRRIKIRKRAPFPKPWKWEIYVGDRLVTASGESYATQDEAWIFGRDALDGIVARARQGANHEVREGRMAPEPTEQE